MSWIKRTFKPYIATFVITLIILFVLESVSSIAYYQIKKTYKNSASSTIQAILKLTGGQGFHSLYEKLRIINKESKREDPLYPNYLFEPQLHHPNDFYYLANVANSRIVGCNESGYFNYWDSDEFGFRNPAKTYENYSDVLLIGDSFTEGACENETGTIAGYLRSSGLKISNLGKGGSGPLQQLATFVEYGPVYKTKKVVWIIFTGNDLHNLREEKTSQLSAYLNASFTQSLFDNSEKVNEKLTDFLEKQISDSNVRMEKGLPLIRNEGYGESLDLIAAQNIETFILNEVAERIFEEVIKLETELAIVILNHPDYDHEIQDITSKTIKEFAVSKEVDYLEISRDYLVSHKSMYTKSGPHFNSSGYRSIGEEIRKWLDHGGDKLL